MGYRRVRKLVEDILHMSLVKRHTLVADFTYKQIIELFFCIFRKRRLSFLVLLIFERYTG
jgi:hypothetical protein